MSELHLQDKFLIPFFRETLGYQEVKPNTITNALIIEEDLQAFISTTELNQKSYETLLKKYSGNAQQLLTDAIALIQAFESKIIDLSAYVRSADDGKRLIVKINSNVPEDEIYEDFAKLYRRYRALNRKQVGDYFFNETEDLMNKLCDDFEATVRHDNA